jgi:predicted ATPase/DNA-binding SARP family transcriptional activator
VEVRVLGDVHVVDGSRAMEPRPLERRLLGALVVSRPSALSYDALAEAVWGQRVPRSAKHSLQAHVQRIRALAGPDLVVTAHSGYRLGAGIVVDADSFERAIDRASSSSAAEALGCWDLALSMWRGIPFGDLDDWAPAGIERTRLVELWNRAAEERCAAALAEAPGADVVAEASRLVQAEPLRERRWALLMSTLDATGRRAEALRTFDRARRTLASELGISPGTELAQLHEALLRDRPVISVPTPRPALPYIVTSIVGRDEQLDALGWLLHESRLVTLTGPAGVGKTRLALAHATRRRGKVGGGVWWVELAAVREASAVEPLIASTLGISFAAAGGAARDSIIGAIGDREMLLVLDNCEHLLEPVATFTAGVLTACPQVRVLTTSREPLAVAGERPMPVPPLPIDGAAVELFVTRTRESDPSFADDDARAIATISRRLDGIPLAIELAAARVRTLGVSEVAARLDHRFDLLTAVRRGPEDRHHTMRAAVDWSYDLLDESARAVFEQLAVFRGRFELEAVEHVVVTSSAANVPVVVASLVDQSMIVADGATPARFRVLEPLRQYAAERLQARRAADTAAQRHAAYYAGLASRLNNDQRGRGEIEAFRRIDAARDNFRAAFQHALDQDDVDSALAIPVYLARYCATHIWSEPWAWSRTALDLPGAVSHPLRPAALLAASDGAWQQGRHARAVELAETVIDLVEPGSELWREAHRVMAGALVWLGRFEDGDTAATTAVAGQSPEVTDVSLTRITTLALIRNAVGRPEPDMARQALADARTFGNPTSLALAYHTAGIVLGRADPILGTEYQREAARLAAATGATLIEGFALAVLAAQAADNDPIGGAQAHLDVMRHYLRVGNRTHLRSFGRGLIRPLVSLHAHQAVAVVDGATRDQPELGELAASRATSTAHARAALGPAYDVAADYGASMTDDELVAHLDEVITQLATPADPR